MTASLNWKQMVEEALRRRKQEGLTQREHAALANVSVPTMAAFERAETTLTLAKAFDVLRVVGLVDEPGPEDEHERFVREAMARWRELTETLPKDSPGRMPHGWFRFDYQLVGELRTIDLTELEQLLDAAELNHTGWPLFLVGRYWEKKPLHHHGANLECWLHEGIRTFRQPAYADYWTANPRGHFMLVRGYKEDSEETFSPGTLFDTSNSIWRIGEALRHAEGMAQLMASLPGSVSQIHFRATYSGLLGRVLKSWANPTITLGYEGRAALRNDTVCSVTVKPSAITNNLIGCVMPPVDSLYSCFGVPEVPREYVETTLTQMLRSSIPNHP